MKKCRRHITSYACNGALNSRAEVSTPKAVRLRPDSRRLDVLTQPLCMTGGQQL
jgi:hypothetical protein